MSRAPRPPQSGRYARTSLCSPCSRMANDVILIMGYGCTLPLLQISSKEVHPMKAVILAGGLGTRLSEETTVRPKPMVEMAASPSSGTSSSSTPPRASTTSSSASATRATSSRSTSPTTSCTPPTSPRHARQTATRRALGPRAMPHESPGNWSVQPCSYSH